MIGATLNRSLWMYSTLSSIIFYYISKDNLYQDIATETKKEYDFIVVGSGTAGSVVANRLSEMEKANVLLLEAGGLETDELQIPAVAPYLQLTDLDWQFQSEPSSTSCLAMVDNRCNLPRGKVLGGSSSINYMIYVRGNKRDYDQWQAFGNNGWSYKDVLPYFKKFEDNKNATLAMDTEYHSVGGYQKISEAPWHTLLAPSFLAAGIELGYPSVDVNGKAQTGFMIPQGYTFRGSRYSASKSYLKPIQNRPNLDIFTKATVTKVLLDAQNKAYGVTYIKEGKVFNVTASREVIISAGAIGSPQLLMLSGIGPADHLRSVGIRPIVNLSVGKNLQDHVAGILHFKIAKGLSLTAQRMESLASVYQYSLWGSGPLTTLGGIEGIGFAHTKYSNRTLDWPDIEFHFLSGSPASDDGHLTRTLNLRKEYWENYFEPLSHGDSYSIVVKLLRPKSRGYIELRSNKPEHHPKIVTNYFSEPFDSIVLSEGLKIAKAVGETKTMKELGSKIYNKALPGCEKFKPKSDRYWECFLRHLSLTIYHYCGTNKMGPYWDPDAVVDEQLRVYGTFNLRVVDASIFPTIPSGNTNAAVLMVAEKISDQIKNFWKDEIHNPATLPPHDSVDKISMITPKEEIIISTNELVVEKEEVVGNGVHKISKRSVGGERTGYKSDEGEADNTIIIEGRSSTFWWKLLGLFRNDDNVEDMNAKTKAELDIKNDENVNYNRIFKNVFSKKVIRTPKPRRFYSNILERFFGFLRRLGGPPNNVGGFLGRPGPRNMTDDNNTNSSGLQLKPKTNSSRPESISRILNLIETITTPKSDDLSNITVKPDYLTENTTESVSDQTELTNEHTTLTEPYLAVTDIYEPTNSPFEQNGLTTEKPQPYDYESTTQLGGSGTDQTDQSDLGETSTVEDEELTTNPKFRHYVHNKVVIHEDEL